MAALTGTIRTTSGITGGHEDNSNLDSVRLTEVFNKNFLKHAVQNVVLAGLAEKFTLPKQAGSMTMRFFRRGEANVDNVRTLTEGTPLGSYTYVPLTPLEVTLSEYGDAAKITMTRQATDLIKQLQLETTRMGEEAALHVDTVVRDAISTEMNLGGNVAQVIDKTDDTTETLEIADIDAAASILQENRAMPLEAGCYGAVVSPRVAYSIRRDADWKAVSQYQDKEKIYTGEIGKIFNVKVIVATNPKTFTFETTKTGEEVFVFGKEFAGTIDLGGEPSALSPRLIYNDKPDKSDPLNQYSIVGWRGYFAAACLNPKFGVMIKVLRPTLN